MNWKLACVITALAFEVSAPRVADACGVKLTSKSPGHKKATARSSNPSDILLLGNPPRRLQRDLSAAGHRVEVAPEISAAKRSSYTVIVADSSLEATARSKFSNSVVVVRSDDIAADVRSVENQITRKPVAADQGRTVVAARPNRAPVATGPTREERKLVSAAEPRDTSVETAPRVAATTEPKKTETKPVESRPEPKAVESQPRPEPKVVEPAPVVASSRNETRSETADASKPAARPAKAATNPGEIYFGFARANLPSTKALDRASKWLLDNPDIAIVIEGHADPSGAHDSNLALAQKRAEWVRDYLVTSGIDVGRLEVISYGDTRLKYAGTDARNRRVGLVKK